MDRQPTNRAAVAGSLLVASILLCTAIGFGIGALAGATGLFAIVGVFVGFAAGFTLLYQRFRDL
jgi:F0F1-type ATP synthase assembly protein I